MNSQDMSYPPIYVINLKRTPERKLHIQRELDALNLPYQFVEAIDKHDLHSLDYRRTLAQQLNIEEHKIAFMYENIDKGSLACALSHIKVYNLMIENNISVACVLEDDGHLLPTFPDVLAASKEVSWDILMFAHQSQTTRQILGRFLRNFNSWCRVILYTLLKLILYKIFLPRLNLYTVYSILRYIAKWSTLRSLNKLSSPNLFWLQYHAYKIGAVPSRDRSSWYKSTFGHYIAQPERIVGNNPVSTISYMLTRSAAIKWKHAIISRPFKVDIAIGYLWREENLNLYMVVPPCVTVASNHIFYSPRLK